MCKKRVRILFAVLITVGLAVGGFWSGTAQGPEGCAIPTPSVEPPAPRDTELIEQLESATAGRVRISWHAETGKVRSVGSDLEHPLAASDRVSPEPTPEEVAREFLELYGPLFGLSRARQDLEAKRVKIRDRGRTFVRFQQVHQGIPVFGGELVVQMDGNRNIVSANGEVLPDVDLDTTPRVQARQAQEIASELVGGLYDLQLDDLVASEPTLWIYNPILLKPAPDFVSLVWRVEVKSKELLPVRELVLVDGRSGVVALHFSQIGMSKSRAIYDNENDPSYGLPGNGPVRTEGQGATGVADVDNAYEYCGDAYDFYYKVHGRDSLDDAGMTVMSTVRYCDEPPADCPWIGAMWNGEQLAFGDGWASADDVVGHEWTHGVTEYESNLFNYMQSGAINEGFSDIWGEFIDLTNLAGNDSPEVRWLLGEDAPYGPGSSMSDPPAYDDPDRMTSSNYRCGEADRGGVHSNAGVVKKAAYLMVDGGTFNGYTVTGIGLEKTARILYEAQTNLLLSASDYADLYDSLRQACINLIGTGGITIANCRQVKRAVRATEMDQQPPGCPAHSAQVCTSGSPIYLFFDDLENLDSGNWTHAAIEGVDCWYYPQPGPPWGTDTTYATSGEYNFFGWDRSQVGDSYMAMTTDVVLPRRGTAFLHFNHAYAFDDSDGDPVNPYDGGVLEYSTNGGVTWNDAGPLISVNGYNSHISFGSGNPLEGRSAFVSESNGYISTRANLTSLAGQPVRFRFRLGTTDHAMGLGWFIDDIGIYICDTVLYDHYIFLPLAARNYGGTVGSRD